MSERAYALLEALAQLVGEMEVLVDCCNADESLAVLECTDDMRQHLHECQKLLSDYRMRQGALDGDDS